MKLIVKDKDKGYLKCAYGRKTTHSIMVELDNLLDFYPLNLSYDLKIDKYYNKLLLCRLSSTLPLHYDDEGISYVVQTIRLDNGLVFPSIKKDNQKIVDKAKSYGLKTYHDNYTKDDIEKNFVKLRIIFEEINNNLVEDYINNYVKDKIAFKTKTKETQLDIALKKTQRQDLTHAYNELGQIYNMCVLMKKRLMYTNPLGKQNIKENISISFEE